MTGSTSSATPQPVGPSPSPHRLRTPRWLDLRLVTGVVLVLVAVLVGAEVVAGAQHTRGVLALARDLAAGSTVQRSDLTSVQVRLPAGSRGAYVTDEDDVVGRRLNRPLGKGELVPTAALGAAAEKTTISIPLGARNAPQLHRGQRVQIWLSTPTCRSVVLLADVTVQAVHAGSGVVGAGVGQDVVLSVAPDLAGRVVAALADSDAIIRAGVLTGTRPAASATDPAGALPALDDCLTPSS